MAGTVATVPPIKRAVHHLTAPHHAPARRIAAPGARPAAVAVRSVKCNPIAPAVLPAVPLITYAAPIPDEPEGDAAPGGGVAGGVPGGVGAIGAFAGGGGGGGVAAVTPTLDPGAVPEPATWLMLISGMGIVGAALRRRRTAPHGRLQTQSAKAALGTALWSSSMAEAGEVATTAAVRSAVVAKSTAAGLAGKALLCVCPAAMLAGSVVAVPPLRHTVHAATAPAVFAPATAGIAPITPCTGDTAVPAATPVTIPVSTASIRGFPATVETIPAA